MASIAFHTPSSKRKKRINSEKLFEFENFAVPDRILAGAFRDNIRIFLQNFAEVEDYTVSGMPVWCTSIVSENDGVFPLYTIEETVENSLSPFCSHCEFSGWGHHFVCKRKYHFVIPSRDNWNGPLDWDFAETQSHNLYGLVHCNGYGHLICINGLKNNSKLFTADDSMEFWDRLCTVLKARSISACYISRKEAIELSLIHGAAYGKSWFRKWGYKFSGGSPGITERKYNAAIRSLSSLSLDKIISDFKNKRNIKKIKEMIELYRNSSENPLVTISDLLKFMLAFESITPIGIYNACKSKSGTGASPMAIESFVNSLTNDCRWSAKRLEHVLFVIVDLLKEHKMNSVGSGYCVMSRQELRDEARKSIGDTGLIDYTLKSIKCITVDNQIIRRAINPFSRLAEFIIHEASPEMGGFGRAGVMNSSRDIRFLYENVLAEYSETRVVLNSNRFVKEWPIKGEINGSHSMKLTCKFLPSFDEMETELARPLSPDEVVVVEPWITIGDLKMAAQCAFRDTYCVMDELEVSQIGGLRKIEEEKAVCSVVGTGGQVWVRGTGMDFRTRLRYEDGWPEKEGHD